MYKHARDCKTINTPRCNSTTANITSKLDVYVLPYVLPCVLAILATTSLYFTYRSHSNAHRLSLLRSSSFLKCTTRQGLARRTIGLRRSTAGASKCVNGHSVAGRAPGDYTFCTDIFSDDHTHNIHNDKLRRQRPFVNTGICTPFVNRWRGSSSIRNIQTSALAVDPVVVRTSLNAMAEFLSQIGLGYLAVRTGLLKGTIIPGLSRAVFNVLLPALLLTSVAKTVAKNPLGLLVPIPLLAVGQSLMGLLFGQIAAKMMGLVPTSETGRMTRVLTAFQNSGVLPLAFINSLFRMYPDKLEHATALTAVFLLGWSPMFWSVGKNILTGEDPPDSQRSMGLIERTQQTFTGKLRDVAKASLTLFSSPPIAACMLGVIIGLTPWIRDLFLPEQAPFRVIFDALARFAEGSMPVSILVLAGTMAQTKPRIDEQKEEIVKEIEKKMFTPRRMLILISIARFVVIPFATLGIVNHLLLPFGWIQNDPMLIFILLLQSAMPSAQNTVTMLQVADRTSAAQRVAKILLQTYVASVVPMCLWITYFLQTSNVMIQ